MLRAVRAIALGSIALGSIAAPAFAHAHLLGGSPAAGAAVPGVSKLVLQFNEPVEPAFPGVRLEDSAGSVVATGPTQIDASDPRTVDVPISGKLAPGQYRVKWHALAVDGHKTTGSYAFTVTP